MRTGKLKKGRQLDGHSRLEVRERLRFLRTLVSQAGSYSIDSRLERERERERERLQRLRALYLLKLVGLVVAASQDFSFSTS